MLRERSKHTSGDAAISVTIRRTGIRSFTRQSLHGTHEPVLLPGILRIDLGLGRGRSPQLGLSAVYVGHHGVVGTVFLDGHEVKKALRQAEEGWHPVSIRVVRDVEQADAVEGTAQFRRPEVGMHHDALPRVHRVSNVSVAHLQRLDERRLVFRGERLSEVVKPRPAARAEDPLPLMNGRLRATWAEFHRDRSMTRNREAATYLNSQRLVADADRAVELLARQPDVENTDDGWPRRAPSRTPSRRFSWGTIAAAAATATATMNAGPAVRSSV